MYAAAPDYHPSRQVERIREILVGRQLEAVEKRLDKLETRVPPLPTAEQGDVFMMCLEVFEKRHNLEIQELRDDLSASEVRHNEQLHRLAAQIQAVAQSRGDALPPSTDLEQRIGVWLQNWQTGFSEHAQRREAYLIQELRKELQNQREWVNSELEKRAPNAAPAPAVHESLTRLAEAARDFAAAAALHTTPTQKPPATPA